MVEHVEGYDKPGSTWLSMCNADHRDVIGQPIKLWSFNIDIFAIKSK